MQAGRSLQANENTAGTINFFSVNILVMLLNQGVVFNMEYNYLIREDNESSFIYSLIII